MFLNRFNGGAFSKETGNDRAGTRPPDEIEIVSKDQIRFIVFFSQDGTVMNMNASQPNLVDTAIPPDFLTKVHIGRCAYDYKPDCTTPGALLTDFNIWKITNKVTIST